MLAILVPALWILFDVLICVRTGYMTAPFPRWESWVWLLVGVVLALLAVVAGWWDRKQAVKEAARKHEEIQESQGALVEGNIAILRQLAAATQTTGQPPVTIIEAAMTRIESLENQVRNQQWRQITTGQRDRFRDALQGERPEIWRIYCVTADSEADSYTKQLMKMIRDCEIVINDYPDKDEDRLEFDTHGLVVLVKNASALSQNAITLTRAFCAASIVYHLTAMKVGRSAPDNYLALRVGPKAK